MRGTDLDAEENPICIVGVGVEKASEELEIRAAGIWCVELAWAGRSETHQCFWLPSEITNRRPETFWRWGGGHLPQP